MRDLKINIRKRAVGTFYEWETLDRAVSGRREALGTKLHQQTRRAILRRQPALLRAINKFNDYCGEFERLRLAGCKIPVPTPLSTQLNGLRNDPALHEDVWITPSSSSIPRWLDDDDVHEGIRSVRVLDRCVEEGRRLSLEQVNMHQWLTQEFAIVTWAMETCTGAYFLLQAYYGSQYYYTRSASCSPTSRALGVATNSRVVLGTGAPTSLSSDLSELEGHLFDDSEAQTAQLAVEDIVALDPEMISDDEAPNVIQEILADSDDDEETSGIDGATVKFKIDWQQVCAMSAGFGWHLLSDDLDRLRNPRWLNNFCINGVAGALLGLLGHPTAVTADVANRCAVLNSFDLHRVRYKASDAVLWHHLAPTRYWDKSVWLIPIHRRSPQHWVLVVVFVKEQQLFFFDSFSQKEGWHADLRVRSFRFHHMQLIAT
ncbi:hypothetical protein GGX14DRAFT_373277 [Mycena pura]|uniref:Ubiquitin-like protease family profile domain-containing protein n=1 Tax=Mycena pura TaxID=153505 RepID=A0AAD6Y8A2_9AGAR|nr:hypothetical protein GGX14DRAFT_373277 [Mycena pura]